MISIIIPVYNRSDLLAKSLRSLEAQTYQDFEIIVIDDESNEDVENVIHNTIRAPRPPKLRSGAAGGNGPMANKLQYFKIAHGGANKARNFGFLKSQGKYIIFWDADVIGRPNMLQAMLKALESRPKASYAYAAHKLDWKGFKSWPFDAKRLKQMPYIHTTSLIRRDHFPGWDESVSRLQDWDLWLTMLEQGHIGVHIPKYLFRVISGGTMSSWLPMNMKISQLLYKKPFSFFLPQAIKENKNKYKAAVALIKKKHELS